MSQIGVIVLSDTINVEAWIAQAKEDGGPKVKVGTVQTTETGVKYIPIEKIA